MDQASSEHDRFVRLFVAHEPYLRAFVRSMLPSRHDVGDVLQDIGLVLWEKFSPACDDAGFRKWALMVASLKIKAWYRDKARDRHVFSVAVLDLLAEEAAQTVEVLSAKQDALRACVEKLSEAQRKLLLAAYATRGDMQSVARESGRSLQAFYRWLHRVRILLLNCVRAELREDAL
jgi:RNA polymerase sigma-70 factor, ECF subfamily